MKNTPYLFTYLSILIIGVLLMIFAKSAGIFETIVIIIGCCFILPSIITLFMGFAGKKAPDGTRTNQPWYMAPSSIAGLIGGVLLVAMPTFFVHYLIYTLGIILVVVGIVQILFLQGEGRDIGGMPTAWYIVPWLTVLGGLVILIAGPERIETLVTMLTGVILTIYAINGLMSAAAHHGAKRKQKRLAASAEGAAAVEEVDAEEGENDSTEAGSVASGREPEEESPGNKEQHIS